MPRYIAFLRAINVGGHIVKMERLRLLFESLGLANVETFIASGNVIFESRATSAATVESKIEKLLHQELGYEVRTFLRTDAELAEIAAYQPFGTAGDGQLFIGFLAGPLPAAAVARLESAQTAIDDFHIHGRELYWRIRGRSSDSRFSGPLLEKTLGTAATLRNSNTVGKLAAKYPPQR